MQAMPVGIDLHVELLDNRGRFINQIHATQSFDDDDADVAPDCNYRRIHAEDHVVSPIGPSPCRLRSEFHGRWRSDGWLFQDVLDWEDCLHGLAIGTLNQRSD